ncbi:glutamyl-tRNA(Gln) amidotransferase subunit A [bacterium BMS3Bbin11]|nr:glutamyl-tRNA(Gln) amidotransferase subunit A [bacterium BMS3Bbin11]HDH08463.1 Asp-tRNA(Asn)/Glu-tRNA(Gln) amidotransferase subunit GatA [Gammaproteobacteria bacterium]HDH15488.1 Asp-tRNA(Asn)/Glu-tRNA(Gln) amidotransferase subunit GatA [Gammaproteobacteria bacterium]
MHKKSLQELALGLANKDFSSVELTRHFLGRIEAHQDINAFITVDHEGSLQQAAEADKLLGAGKALPLTGIPLAHKDIFCTDGLRTSCGSKMLDNFIAPYDATLIRKFRQTGSVTLGKTNMDEFAMGSSNETSYYGPVLNPWNKEHVPGGSSGGSAAAVAAQLAPAATGTDTGGSIRQPASFCGLTGLKPSYGRVSRYGMIAFASSLDQAGPMSHSAADAAILLQTMSGFDERDSTSVDIAVPDFSAALENDLKGLKIGMPIEFFNDDLDPGIASITMDALREYEKIGAELVEISLPNSHLSVPCYYVLAPAEASSNLSRFDGARYGYRTAEYNDLLDMYKKTRAEGFGDEVKRRIMIGTYALSAGYYDAYYLKAQKIRRLISEDFTRAFEECDVIAGPTAPETAFHFGDKSDDPVAMYLNDIYTISVNLAGLPGISIPVGMDKDNLPVGLQLIGQYFDEAGLLNVAHRYQQVTDWHTLRPLQK